MLTGWERSGSLKYAKRQASSEVERQYWPAGGEACYDEITDKIIVELEAGRVPWVQPWGSAAVKAHLAIPKNACTARRYSGRRGHD
jgi:antirestriction protein ArdC